jgi:hypothetical protein
MNLEATKDVRCMDACEKQIEQANLSINLGGLQLRDS